jgi:hypothetical protein
MPFSKKRKGDRKPRMRKYKFIAEKQAAYNLRKNGGVKKPRGRPRLMTEEEETLFMDRTELLIFY